MRKEQQHPAIEHRTSRFEKRSLSMKSATPSSLALVSANAIPTNLVLALLVPEEDILRAKTIGGDVTSELTKRRSSTA